MGFFSDLFDFGRDVAQDTIEDAARSEAKQLQQRHGTSAHIAAQNEVVRNFELQALTPYRAGHISASQAIATIERLDTTFAVFCQQLGYDRAFAGARDVHNLAVSLVAGLRAATSLPIGGGGGVVIPGRYTPSGRPQPVDYTTLALVGVAAYLLFFRK